MVRRSDERAGGGGQRVDQSAFQRKADLVVRKGLVADGHIHVVAEPDQISDELQKHDFDIVLAYFSQRDVVEAQTAASSATYLPVAIDGTEEEAQAKGMYERSLSNEDSVKRFLKTIHKTLKAQI